MEKKGLIVRKKQLSTCLLILYLYSLANAGACAIASAPRFSRVWEQIQSRLGSDSVTSAPRFGRRWEQIRMPLLPDSPKVIVLEMVGFR